jgi:hypothetical protein
MVEGMRARHRVALGLVLAAALSCVGTGCAPWTPEQQAAAEEIDRQRAAECMRRGGWYVSGSCVSRGGGA